MIKKGDFVELDYTGIIKETNDVFDTTDAKFIKESGFAQDDIKSKIICIGEKQILESIDENLIGKEPGKEYIFEFTPEKSFGKKDPKLIQLISTNKFRKEKINPQIGLQINVDGMRGTIKTVSGGRTLVDFNHPLSGKDVIYKVNVKKIVIDTVEKVKSIIQNEMGMEGEIIFKEGACSIGLSKEIPDKIKDVIKKRITGIIPEIKTLIINKQ